MTLPTFNEFPPKNIAELDKLFAYPPTTIWESENDPDSLEQVRIKINKISPSQDSWTIEMNDKIEKEKFKILLHKKDNDWSFDVIEATPFFKESLANQNTETLENILIDLSVSAFDLQGKSSDNYSPQYEKENTIQAKARAEKSSKNDDISDIFDRPTSKRRM